MLLTETRTAAPDAAATQWKEEVVQIGLPVPMHGVLTMPQGNVKSFALVILNSGLLHHVGSCCLSVKVARAAASHGVTVLRYDASGIGDSAPRNSDLPQDRRAVGEVREVLDHLQHHYGFERFAVIGLCSGAFTSFEAALDDPRVIGVAQIAAFAYRTTGWYLRHYGARLFAWRSWRNVVLRQLGAHVETPRGLALQYIDEESKTCWDIPKRQEVEQGYRRLLARRVTLLNIMTGGEADTYLYQGQFRHMFPTVSFGANFEEHYFPHASHIVTEPRYQREVLDTIINWLDRAG